MTPWLALAPAPGRGQYDRSLPRERRLAEQRERLLAATALVVTSEAAPSVSSLVRRAGVGRNTFYEYFDDVEHAKQAAIAAMLRRMEQLLREAESVSRTPVERWRALSHAWFSLAEQEPAGLLLALALEASSRRPLSAAGAVLEAALVRSLETLRAAGVASPLAASDRVGAVAAAGEASARALAGEHLEPERADAGAPPSVRLPVERERVERSWVDIAVRLLR